MSIKKYWAEILVFLIFALSVYVRLVGFHYPYLRNIDSYAFYRQMEYIYEHGHLPEIDTLMLAPTGKKMSFSLYPYIGAYLFKLVKVFLPNLELWRFLIYLPALIASLSVFPLYIAGKNLYDKKAGLFFSFLMIFSPQMMSRTLGGDPDSDCIVFFATSLVFMTISYVIKFRHNQKKMRIAAIWAGLAFTFFALTWVGYWYFYWITLGFVVLEAVLKVARSQMRNKKFTIDKTYLIPFAILTITMVVTALPFFGLNFLKSTFLSPFETISLFSSTGGIKGEGGQFPNVYVSVAEMMSPGSVMNIVMSNPSHFLLTLLAIVYLISSFVTYGKHSDTLSFLLSWFLVTFYASMTAVRFMIFLAMPLAFGTAIILSKVFRMFLGEDKDVSE